MLPSSIEPALRDRDQRAAERQAGAARTRGIRAPCCAAAAAMPGGTAIGWPRASRPCLPTSKRTMRLHALDAEPDRAAVLARSTRCRTSRAPRAASVGPEHRRHLGIRDAGRARALIDDAAAQPAALVGHGEEARAVGLHADRRDAAELRVRRGQLDAAAKGERRRSARAADRAARMPRSAAP